MRLVLDGGGGIKEGFLEETEPPLELSPQRCVEIIQEKRWDEEHSRERELCVEKLSQASEPVARGFWMAGTRPYKTL